LSVPLVLFLLFRQYSLSLSRERESYHRRRWRTSWSMQLDKVTGRLSCYMPGRATSNSAWARLDLDVDTSSTAGGDHHQGRFHGTRWRVPLHNSLPSLGLNRVWRYAHSNCMFNWNSVWSHQQSHNNCCLMCMWFYVQLKWKTWSMQTWTDTKRTTVLISSFFWKFTFCLLVLFQRSTFFYFFEAKKT
jgi:hypothetical protein